MNNRWFEHTETLIIGHRGAMAHAPENTLQAMLLAQAQGAAGIEFDVRLTKDGHVVVIHDDTLDRTTDMTGAVAEMTLVEVKSADCGNGTTIPTLSEVFEACGPNFLYNVELKDDTEACVQAVLACIATHNIGQNVVISSFEQAAMRWAKQLVQPPIAQGMLRYHDSPPHPDWFAGQAVHPHFTMVDADYMAWAASHNYHVNVWTVNDVEEANRLKALGVAAVITNSPEQLLGS